MTLPAAGPMRNKSSPVTVLGRTSVLMLAALCGCASPQVALVGHARPAFSPDQVQIYLQPPESKYQEIANLSASSRGFFAFSAAAKIDQVIERLKEQAA